MKLAAIPSLLSAAAAAAAASGESDCVPPPIFTEGTPAIHIVMSITEGEFFANFLEGAEEQASFLGPSGAAVVVHEAGGDDATQAALVAEAAQDGNAVGILTVGGSAEALCPAINDVTSDDGAVVSFDLDGEVCSSEHVTTSQADDDMATLVLDQALKERGGDVTVGYVNDLNFAPLQKRDEVWESYKEANNWTQAFFVEDAANFSSAEALQLAIEEAMKGVAPRAVDFIYAPWDYLAVNSVVALAMQTATTAFGTAVYGADFNDEDIGVMIRPNSPWKATAGGDPRAIGAALVRMVARSAAGELDGTIKHITLPSILLTQTYLLANNITDLNELDAAMPELALRGFMTACWITEDGNWTYPSEENAESPSDEENEESSARALPTTVLASLVAALAWWA